jgi:hypothetical protein
MRGCSHFATYQSPDESGEPYLKRSLQVVEKQIKERIEAGESLTSASNPMSSIDQLKARREAMHTWDEYNRTMLRRLFGGGILDHYTQPIASAEAVPLRRPRSPNLTARSDITFVN